MQLNATVHPAEKVGFWADMPECRRFQKTAIR
jgi:hypothetical protein